MSILARRVTKGEATAIAYYQAARQELVQRITLRDGALIFYITLVGAYFGFLVSNVTDELFSNDPIKALIYMLPLPFLSLTFTLIVLQHHIVIGKLNEYITQELTPEMRRQGLTYTSWDTSSTLGDKSGFFHKYRLFSQSLMLSAPLSYHIYFFNRYWKASWPETSVLRALIVADLLLAGTAFVFVARMHWLAHCERESSSARNQRSSDDAAC